MAGITESGLKWSDLFREYFTIYFHFIGGDIIFDGENFRGIPRKAITIAVWVKLSTALGIQSIFDTIGGHSRHRDGQYHFEIDNGRVRWFHRNEDGNTVFSVVTDDIVVREGKWTLITGTYSADRNRARVSKYACILAVGMKCPV